MEHTGYEHLLIRREGAVLRVSLNAPERLNAIGFAMQSELLRLFQDLRRDRVTAVMVLTGEGRAFSAGGDLNHSLDLIGDTALIKEEFDLARRFVHTLLEVEQPIICRLNGDAIGLGATLALFCDLIVAVDSARIGDPHVRVGLVAGDGGAIAWPLLVGMARAKQYLLGGELLSAAQAQQIGLVNFCVPANEVDTLCRALGAAPGRGRAQRDPMDQGDAQPRAQGAGRRRCSMPASPTRSRRCSRPTIWRRCVLSRRSARPALPDTDDNGDTDVRTAPGRPALPRPGRDAAAARACCSCSSRRLLAMVHYAYERSAFIRHHWDAVGLRPSTFAARQTSPSSRR
jgi:enoyl-CoA hydratase